MRRMADAALVEPNLGRKRSLLHTICIVPVAIALATGLAACGGSAAPTATGPAAGSPAPTSVPSVEVPRNATVIELSIPKEGRGSSGFEADGRRVETISVKSGRPYVFRITNTLSFGHNFFIGVAKDLAAREYDRLHGVHAWAEGVREVVYTFEKSGPPLQFACTLAGHYGLMHADIVVEP